MELASTNGARHVPEELLLEILCRLPVKSLLRFRCVSKPWLALVDDDADFARLHINTFKNNRDQTRLFVVEVFQQDCTVRCADTLKSISKIPASLYVDEGGGKIVSSVDGLVLLELHNVFKLWNPSLRQIRRVPPAPHMDPNMRTRQIGALGYDPMAKDYKIVMLIYSARSESSVLPLVAVYTVGASSWKTIPFRVEKKYTHFRGGEYLQGSFYFLALGENSYGRSHRDLVSFDVSKEVFSCTRLPYEFDDDWYFKLVLIDGGSSVALWDQYGRDNFIWVLDRERMSWMKRGLYNLQNNQLLCSKKNGDMLTARGHCNDEWTWVQDVASYSFEKHEYKILLQKTPFLKWIRHVIPYVESLNKV